MRKNILAKTTPSQQTSNGKHRVFDHGPVAGAEDLADQILISWVALGFLEKLQRVPRSRGESANLEKEPLQLPAVSGRIGKAKNGKRRIDSS